MSINLQKIGVEVLDFIRKEEGKLPLELVQAAALGEKYVTLAANALKSGQALDFTAMVPAAEPLREGIVVILTEAETAFHAVDTAFQGGILLTANARIAALQVPGADPDHLVLAAQAGYVDAKHPTAAATESTTDAAAGTASTTTTAE